MVAKTRTGPPGEKRAKFLRMGATVWEAWAQSREVRVYTPGEAAPTIERETLTFARLPGLAIPLAVVFAKFGSEKRDE